MKIKKVGLGSTNPVKYRVVSYVLHKSLGVMPCSINQIKVDSGVRAQLLSAEEVFTGAENRAKRAFLDNDLSVGVESGLIQMSNVNGGYLNVCGCAIYDGKRFSYALSPAFELPSDVLRDVLHKEVEIDEALVNLGMAKNPNIGESVGLIGILTDNEVVREDLVKIAVTLAVMPFKEKNKDWYFR